MYIKELGMRIRVLSKNSTQYLHIALTAVITVHIGKSTELILSCDRVTLDRVWISNRIYWTLTLVTTNNYDSLTELHTPKITVTTANIKSS
jgi:hypothetical protein